MIIFLYGRESESFIYTSVHYDRVYIKYLYYVFLWKKDGVFQTKFRWAVFLWKVRTRIK